MATIEIDLLKTNLEAAYRADRWHSLLNNLEPVTDDEWELRPAEYSVELFGTDPELSIGHIVAHVTGAIVMYTNRAFGDATMTWDRIQAPGAGKAAMLSWLDGNVAAMLDGLSALLDDAELAEERETHWGARLPVSWFVRTVTNHMLYHSGEINRQLSIIRGTSGGWVAS